MNQILLNEHQIVTFLDLNSKSDAAPDILKANVNQF